jgi:hypothetical protein
MRPIAWLVGGMTSGMYSFQNAKYYIKCYLDYVMNSFSNRPEYRKLMWLHNSYPNVPFMALSATATPAVQLRIEQVLGLRNVMR